MACRHERQAPCGAVAPPHASAAQGFGIDFRAGGVLRDAWDWNAQCRVRLAECCGEQAAFHCLSAALAWGVCLDVLVAAAMPRVVTCSAAPQRVERTTRSARLQRGRKQHIAVHCDAILRPGLLTQMAQGACVSGPALPEHGWWRS